MAGLLDRTAPGWRHSFVREQQLGRHVVVTASITIGGATREGLGTGPAGSETGLEAARLDALFSAAAKFGVARGFFASETGEARDGDREDSPRPPP